MSTPQLAIMPEQPAQHEETVAMKAMPVIVKLAQVMAEMDRVKKNGYNQHFKYSFVQESDLVEAIRSKLAERSIMLVPSLVRIERTPITRTDREGHTKESMITTAYMRFTFVDGNSGDSFSADWAGDGEDGGDKGLYKSYTGAEKTFLLKTFLISTGHDPERDSKRDERPRNQQQQNRQQQNSRPPAQQPQRPASGPRPAPAAVAPTEPVAPVEQTDDTADIPRAEMTREEALKRKEIEVRVEDMLKSMGQTPKQIADKIARLKTMTLDEVRQVPAKIEAQREQREKNAEIVRMEALFKEQGWDEDDQKRYLGGKTLAEMKLDEIVPKREELERDTKPGRR